MPADAWARGARIESGAVLGTAVAEGPPLEVTPARTRTPPRGRPRRPPGQAARGGRPAIDPARRGGIRGRRRGAPRRRLRQPGAARAAARDRGHRPGRRVRDRADLRHAAQTGTLDAIVADAADRADGAHRPAGPRRAADRRVPAAQHARAARTPRSRPRSTWSAPWSPAPPGSPTPSCAASPSATCAAWLARLAPDRPTRSGAALNHAHPQWIVRAFTDALGAPRRGRARCSTPTTARPPVHLVRPARPARPGRAGREAAAARPARVLAVRGRAGRRRRPGRHRRRSATAVPHVQDEGSQLVAAALAAAPARTGRDERWLDLCAGPGGKAGAARRARRAAGARTLTAVEVAPHRAELVGQADRGLPVDAICTPTAATSARTPTCPRAASTGCWSTRRAPAWARCAAGRRPAGAASRRTCRR